MTTDTNRDSAATAGTTKTPQLFVYFLTVEDMACRRGRHVMQIEIFRSRRMESLRDVNEAQTWLRTQPYGMENPMILGFTLVRMASATEPRGRS
jgi:hypothetical protein